MEDAFLVCVYQSNVFWKIYKIEFEYLGLLKNNTRGRLHLFVVLKSASRYFGQALTWKLFGTVGYYS